MAGREKLTRLRYSTVVAAPPDAAFRFLSKPAHAEILSPPKLEMRNMSTEDAAAGVELEYIFRWSGIPLYMRLAVECMEAPRRLALTQTLGPWRHYRHVHELTPVPQGTRIDETIEFIRRPGLIELILDRFSVQPFLREIAAYRQRALAENLGRHG